MIYFVFALGIYNVLVALIMECNNLLSKFVFKVIPFFLSAITIIYVLKLWEVL